MTIDSGLLAAVLLTASTLWVRMSIQGFEQAVLSTAIEDCLNGIKAVRQSGRRVLIRAASRNR
jgi:hypothetical protein